MDASLELKLTIEQFVQVIRHLPHPQLLEVQKIIGDGSDEVRRSLSEAIAAIWTAGSDGRAPRSASRVAETRAEYRGSEPVPGVVLEIGFEEFANALRRLDAAALQELLEEVEDWFLAQRLVETDDDVILSEDEARQEYRRLLAESR